MQLVFNVTFSNISAISWRPVLVVEEAGVPKKLAVLDMTGFFFSMRQYSCESRDA
jgi:hypothetical protein